MLRLVIFAVLVGYCAAANLAYSNNYNVQPQNQYVQNYQSVRTYNSPQYSTQRTNYRVTPNVRQVSTQGSNNYEIVKAVGYNPYLAKKAVENNPFLANRNTVAHTNVARTQVVGPAEQMQTLIYLLSKQPDIADLVKRFREIQISAIRQPEVHFIKYRNPEDIQHIKAQIKAQYNNSPDLVNNINGLGAAISAQTGTPISTLTQGSSTTNQDDDLYTAKRPPFLPTGVDVVPGSSYLPPSRG